MKKPRLILTIVLGVVLCLCVVGYRAYRELTQIDIGEKASRVDWLPEAASNISYYRSYKRTAYEFDITELEFISLAESRGWRMQRIGNEPITMRRYHWCQHPAPPNSLPPSATESEILKLQAQLAAWETAAIQQISNGYAYDIHGRMEIGYDTSLKRAYVFTTPR